MGAEELVRAVHALGPRAVVLTGGHREEAVDLFFDGDRLVEIPGERFESGAAHGSGCTHSSALAAHLALGLDPLDAARAAKAIASEAVRDGLTTVGHGPGPVDVFGLERAPAQPLDRHALLVEPRPHVVRRVAVVLGADREAEDVAGVVADLVAPEREVGGHRDGHHHGAGPRPAGPRDP